MNVEVIMSEIRDLRHKDMRNWVKNRINYLEANTKEKDEVISSYTSMLRKLNNYENTEVCDYIPSTTRIKIRPENLNAFRIDDDQIYYELCEEIMKLPNGVRINHAILFNLIQKTILLYFGGNGHAELRDQLWEARGVNEKEALSMRDYKDRGAALCAERAAVAHNLLTFAGYESIMVFGYKSTCSDINDEHTFNCVAIEDEKRLLVDFTNPYLVAGNFFPEYKFLEESEYQDFVKGVGQLEVYYRGHTYNSSGIMQDKSSVVYTSERIPESYFSRSNEPHKKVLSKGLMTAS